MTQLVVQGLGGPDIVLAGLEAVPGSSSVVIAAGGIQLGGRLVPGWGVVRPCYVTLGGQGGAPEPDEWPDGPLLVHWLDDQGVEQLDVADCMQTDEAAAAVAAYLGESAIGWDQIIGWVRLTDVPL